MSAAVASGMSSTVTVICFGLFPVFDKVPSYSYLLQFNGVPQATQEELKAAYRRLCMLYHPDKHRDPELKQQAEQLFNLVHEAYEGSITFEHMMMFTPVSSARETDETSVDIIILSSS